MKTIRSSAAGLLLLCAALLALPACGGGPGGGPGKASAAAEHPLVRQFKQDQEHARTPHGEVVLGSVRHAGGATVEYRTADGKLWRVDMRPRADGSEYAYENVREAGGP
jgi:hypothetical protein